MECTPPPFVRRGPAGGWDWACSQRLPDERATMDHSRGQRKGKGQHTARDKDWSREGDDQQPVPSSGETTPPPSPRGEKRPPDKPTPGSGAKANAASRDDDDAAAGTRSRDAPVVLFADPPDGDPRWVEPMAEPATEFTPPPPPPPPPPQQLLQPQPGRRGGKPAAKDTYASALEFESEEAEPNFTSTPCKRGHDGAEGGGPGGAMMSPTFLWAPSHHTPAILRSEILEAATPTGCRSSRMRGKSPTPALGSLGSDSPPAPPPPPPRWRGGKRQAGGSGKDAAEGGGERGSKDSGNQSFRGVAWDKVKKMWRVRVTLVGGGRAHVGYYNDEAQGAAAYSQALRAPGRAGLCAERPQALKSLGQAASASEAVNPGANGPFGAMTLPTLRWAPSHRAMVPSGALPVESLPAGAGATGACEEPAESASPPATTSEILRGVSEWCIPHVSEWCIPLDGTPQKSTGVPHLQENAPPQDPTVGLCLGS